MEYTLGIDLGTFNSAAAVALGRDNVVMVESRQGQTPYGKQFPSFVLFDHNGQKQAVGKRAKWEMSSTPKLVVWGVKRLVGLSYEEAEKRGEFKRFAYAVEPGPGGSILVRVGNERFTPSHVLECILREIREDAANPVANPLLGTFTSRAVVSVPAYFRATRTDPILEAARRAGFTEVDTIAEPTAAAIRYGLEIKKEACLLAFDLGAGTLDVTVMQILLDGAELVPGELSTSGHESFGGLDMDDLLVAYVRDRYGLSQVEGNPGLLSLLREEVEKAKIRLSTRETTQLEPPNAPSVTLSREELEAVLKDMLERCRGPIRVALQQAEIGAKDLDHVLFVGGPTGMPCVRRVVEDELRQLGARNEVIASLSRGGPRVDPMTCVAEGAALKAGRIIEPVLTTLAEGYGTILGPVGRGTDYSSSYYAAIIQDNSPYPIAGSSEITHSNPAALEVPIPLAAKRPDPDKSTRSKLVYRYDYLGDYTISVAPTGELPVVNIELRVTGKKRLVATLKSRQHTVCFESLDLLKGREVTCQEHTPTKVWGPDDIKGFVERHPVLGGWTPPHLVLLDDVAQRVLALVKDKGDPTMRGPVSRLERALASAATNPDVDPNGVCPDISDRTKELVDALRQPGVKQQIDEATYRRYLDELSSIARG